MHPQTAIKTPLRPLGAAPRQYCSQEWPRVSLLQTDAFSDKIPQPFTMDFTE